jgi:glycosyltransferase involved in cell wall biosynthesis
MHLQTTRHQEMVRAVLHGVDRILAVSPSLAEIMREFCPTANIQVLGNVIRTNYFTPQSRTTSSERSFRFLLLAALREHKGIQHFLHAAARLLKEGISQWEAVIGGDGPYRKVLETLVRDLNLEDRCHFVGWQMREHAKDQLRWCDALVLPSQNETFGVVLGEAMACGKPVISTRCGGPDFIVTPDTGILVAPGNAEELATALADVVLARRSFEAEAIRASVVDRFGEEAFVAGLTKHYHEVLTDCQARTAGRLAVPLSH